MDFINILINRVKDINVFNLIEGRMFSYYTHLNTVVDDDLIEEFLSQISGLGEIANSLGKAKEHTLLNFSQDLKRVGEIFFNQFFPEEIQEYLRYASQSFLFLHVAPRLANIPWELLYNTDHFLAERFYIAKNISAYWTKAASVFKEHLRMLIIADPTEDLEWAREEGEKLFEALNSEMNAEFFEVQILSGKRINKIELLHDIKECDIIHYAGHTYVHTDPQESGWLLAEGKVLRAREIKKAGASPILVFSSSCASYMGQNSSLTSNEKGVKEKNIYLNDLADAFMRTGISSYVGTNWELEDSLATCDFALHFYRSIFDAKPLGQALFEARKYARNTFPKSDLTWANYVLYGDPSTRITRLRQKPSFDASLSKTLLWRVRENYPLPIAHSYLNFVKKNEENKPSDNFKLLADVFQNCIQFLAALSFANCLHFDIALSLPEPGTALRLKELVDWLYRSNKALGLHKNRVIPSRFVSSLYLHREEVKNMLKWLSLFQRKKISAESIGSYLTGFQYFLENFLEDLHSLGDCQLLYIRRLEEPILLLNGQSPKSLGDSSLVLNAFLENKKYTYPKEQIFFFHPSRNVLLSLSRYLQYDVKAKKLSFLLAKNL